MINLTIAVRENSSVLNNHSMNNDMPYIGFAVNGHA